MLLGLRRPGPQKSRKKIAVSIRLSPDVVEGLRATGNGRQSRAYAALRSWLEESRKDRAVRPAASR
jgi:uncharacterized protein (DUF4415 family)